MAGKTAKGKSNTKKESRPGASRAGLVVAPARVQRALRAGMYAERVGSHSGVFMAGVIEYLLSEILESAGNFADEDKKKGIKPRHLQLAFRNDTELNKLFHDCHIDKGGVMPNVHEALFPKKGKKNAEPTQEM